jgi:hypothetical protein
MRTASGPAWSRSAIPRSTDHPVLVADLLDDGLRPFQCIPPELRAAENNLNIANMDRESFTGQADQDGVYRGLRA